MQQESWPWDLLPAPLRLLSTSAWGLGGVALALGRSAEPYGFCSAVGRCIYSSRAEAMCCAWLKALCKPSLESDAGQVATPSDTLSVRPGYIIFSVLTVLVQGPSAAQWHACCGEGEKLSTSGCRMNIHRSG